MSLIYIQGEEEKRKHIHYEVDPELPSLGEGGMGQVLKGVRVNEDNGVRMDVAIKFLFEDLPAHAIERAKREASIQIHNENLVEMFGFIEIVENPQSSRPVKRYHVVSELLQGVMLFDLLNGKTTDKNGNDVPFAQELYTKYQNDRFGFAVFIVKNILSGLMALHDKGYIHRDLDPSNIMITVDRKVKIIDFGIAKQLDNLNTQDQQLTSTGQFIGKAAYAAPELVLGDVHNQDKTTDIYAVGIMLFQFITGSMPFEGTMAELIKKQLNEKIPLKLIPYKAVRNIVAKATAKKQSDRYQSATEMRVDLEHLSKADAVPSATSTGQVVASLADVKGNKNKLIGMIAAAVVVLGVIIGIAVMSSGPSEEEVAQAQKESLYQDREGKVIDSDALDVVTDPETNAKQTPVGMLMAEAMKSLSDPTKIKEGVKQLTDIATSYGDYKNAADAVALLAALTQPVDAEISADEIKQLREMTKPYITRDAKKAHQYAEQAVKSNSESYKALFELATDYVAGEIRTGDAREQDIQKSLKLFKDGIEYARQKNDVEYVKLYMTRIDQVSALAAQPTEE
ncbi:MAG: serine/threonine protein kinase [Prevotella sp.]|nr:serine/threonine protein kinase [Prevotella sp.]